MVEIRAKKLHVNPTQEQMKQWVAEMPNAKKTSFGSYSVQTVAVSRSKESTFIVSDVAIQQKSITKEKFQAMAKMQDEYMAKQEMILIEGNIGPVESLAVGSQLFVEKANANIAAMQQQLYFPKDKNYKPVFTIIYTPNLKAEGFPDNRLIAVDLENLVTRVFGSDYFGESKKGGLRMWNHYIYNKGGLALHAGCKVYPGLHGDEKSALIIGLSGTGKTTTTFRQQLDSEPVQDDFCALMPGGEIVSSENGCFAKTFALDPQEEPTIHKALTQSSAWLENVAVHEGGKIDFFDATYTSNGRGTFTLDHIPHRKPFGLPKVSYLFILNRNLNLIPAVAKLKKEQIPAFFMLGETTGTSAGGSSEEGKALRVPGTNPFFPGDDSKQGNRILELLKTIPNLEVYIINTGRVGGTENINGSKKVKIRHSSAVIEGIVKGNVQWVEDPDFGYYIAKNLPGFDDQELLEPKKLYQNLGRETEYQQLVSKIKNERIEYLKKFSNLSSEICDSVK